MLSHVDWSIVTDVDEVRSAFFFRINESKKGKSWTLMMKVELLPKTATTIYQTTRRNIREILFISITSLRS